MIDLGPLIKGLLVVIGIAMATGHYGDLQRWARREVVESLEWKQDLPDIFAYPPHPVSSTHPRRNYAH